MSFLTSLLINYGGWWELSQLEEPVNVSSKLICHLNLVSFRGIALYIANNILLYMWSSRNKLKQLIFVVFVILMYHSLLLYQQGLVQPHSCCRQQHQLRVVADRLLHSISEDHRNKSLNLGSPGLSHVFSWKVWDIWPAAAGGCHLQGSTFVLSWCPVPARAGLQWGQSFPSWCANGVYMQVTVQECSWEQAFINCEQNLGFLITVCSHWKRFSSFSLGKGSTMVMVEGNKLCIAHNGSL